MKRFSCLSLRSVGLGIACIDLFVALSTLSFCSYCLYNYSQQISYAPEKVKVQSPLGNLIASMVDFVLLQNFSNVFYMVLAVVLWVKALINLVVASMLVDGIRKQRLICIAPWLINTIVSIIIEIAVFVFMEIKIDEIDTSVERRIVRIVIFGLLMILNALFTFGIFALYKMFKALTNENQTLQESTVESTGIFQHVKV